MSSSDTGESIDLRVVSQLMAHKRMGQTAFERLLPIFVEEAHLLVAQIRCAVAAADAEGLRLTAHKLKGSASVLGAAQVRSISQAIMEEATEELPLSLDRVQSLEAAITAFHRAAQELIAR